MVRPFLDALVMSFPEGFLSFVGEREVSFFKFSEWLRSEERKHACDLQRKRRRGLHERNLVQSNEAAFKSNYVAQDSI